MKANVLILMIALLTASFTVNTVYSQLDGVKLKKTPEERAKKVSEKLGEKLSLSGEQQSNVYDIILSHSQQADQIRATETDKETKKSQLKSLRQSTDLQIQLMLTNNQKVKYEELKQMIKERRKQKKGKL